MKHRPLVLRPQALALAMASALPALAAAAPASTSAYRTDAQNTYVEDATSRGVGQVNMITCIMSALRPDALVNQPDYNALVDQKKCDPEARSSSGNSGADAGAANAPSYMNAVVRSTRASNDDPMRARIWIDEKEKDVSATIFVNVSASESPSAANPYGVFRLDYCGKPDGDASCMMRGFLQGAADGVSYFENEGNGSTKALQLTTSGTDGGAGVLQMSEQGQNVGFTFAYNASLFRRSDGAGQDQCFSRDASDPDTGMSVWRYGLYDATTGERVTRMSGFPIDYTAQDGTVVHGQMGYWGLWMPAGVSVPNGATVQRVAYNGDGQAPTKTDYSLMRADGRLTKYTKQTRKLNAIDKIHFQAWIGEATGFFAGAQGNQQYEMYWDDAQGAFKVTGMMSCNNGPCQTSSYDTEKTVQPAYFASTGGVRGNSQSLGGELFIPLAGVNGSIQSASVDVIYRTQDTVYPADMPASLYCLRECPTAATLGAYFANGAGAPSPFVASTYNNWSAKTAGETVAYTLDAATGMLKDANGSAVAFTDADALQQHPQFQSGVRSGRMVTSLAAAQCADNPGHYCDWQVDQAQVYYQWETGPNQWNQFAALKDGSGALVQFQAPLQVSYSVPAGAAYGAYAGKSIVLQYGGFGDLWGIPGECVSHLTNEKVGCDTPDSRYVPAFVIPADETLGRVDNAGTPLLVKWLEREIRFAKKNIAVCSSANLALPSGLVLPDANGLQDTTQPGNAVYIGPKPTVTEAPRVIHGEVKF